MSVADELRFVMRLSLTALLLIGCDEDPIPIRNRVWCIEQSTRSLYSLPLDSPSCNSRGYVSAELGPIAMDFDERILSVDLLRRELVELQPDDGYMSTLFPLSQVLNPRALCVAPGDLLYLLDDERRVLLLDRESGAWVRAWPIRPEGVWRGLAWLPEDVLTSSNQVVPSGTLLVWRPMGSGGELAWLELLEEEALAHVLMPTPGLSAVATSLVRRELYGLDPAGSLHRLRPDLQSSTQVQTYPCEALSVTDMCIP